jgi:putative Mg2+ transporter-C (MgtC) family protein
MLYIFADINASLFFATMNMALALILGSVIGSERQLRGRMAGLRTNALVSLGAAGFVIFASLFPDDINPTRVAAQVVSGIGFLGAGIIFRDGFNIQGINTAATLWCSAAVGLISGTGHVTYAIALTSLIVFSNLGLRPIARLLKSIAPQVVEEDRSFHMKLACLHDDERDIRASLAGHLGSHDLDLTQIISRSGKNTAKISVMISGLGTDDAQIKQVVSQMSLDPRVLRIDWSAADDDDIQPAD